MKENIGKNIAQLYGRIADACEEYDRDTDDITLVAVTKTHPSAVIRTAVAAGIQNIGENRVQEADEKISELGQIARFHMIGHLQTNKVKRAVQLFDVIQSVDSLKLAQEIHKQADLADFSVDCLLEVNCSGESQKFGVSPDDCLELCRQVNEFSRINLAGLMTVGPLTDDEDRVRAAFRLCRDLFVRGRDIFGDDFDTLSMGRCSGSAAACLAAAKITDPLPFPAHSQLL